ncbi:MAG: FAD-dependent oxidoreductase [Deltaproteobacteria bacterium]|nr:FAD-dependent oxidoreductase [Deltaproteobacteria bacterium]MBW2385554.1 FAD-dependent oxidoreductase [Deltaproteobacteria bacterium]
MNLSERIVVAGGSLAGLRSIEAMRREGYAGEIVALCAEAYLPYDRPPLSKQFLKGAWDEDKLALRRQGVEDLEVDWRLGRAAASLDVRSRRVKLADGGSVEYGGLLIATGSRARALPGSEDLARVHVLRGLDDARALRAEIGAGARLVVIGAGFIGMEVAASARELGADVTVVEALEAPLLRGLGRTLGDVVGQRFRDHGVTLHCGASVSGFEGDAHFVAVELADGTRLEADVVVVGIGVVPACDWLADSGLDISNGVRCDATGATGLPDIVAAGDVARWHNPLLGRAVRYEHWTSAVEQSTVAAARLIDSESVEPLVQVPYVWSDQFEMRIAIVGEVADADKMHVCHGALDEERFLALFGRRGKLIGAVGMKRPRPLGACQEGIARGVSFEDAVKANA